MGRLRLDGAHPLRHKHRIGRHEDNDLVVSHAVVSGDHAVITWTREGWSLRDLGSTNGTFLDGRRLEPGVAHGLAPGAVVRFGAGGPEAVFEDAGTPVPFATGSGTVVAAHGLIQLDNATVYRDWTGTWVAELGDTTRPVRDRSVLDLPDGTWRLHLPEALAETQGRGAPNLDEVALSFVVSLDEEHTELTLEANGRCWELGTRAHHYLLLTLARAREADENGWVEQDALCRMLQLDDNHVHQQIHRARRQVAEHVEGAAGIVERRTGRLLRLGVPPARVRIARR